jgi:hypothetical protein
MQPDPLMDLLPLQQRFEKRKELILDTVASVECLLLNRPEQPMKIYLQLPSRMNDGSTEFSYQADGSLTDQSQANGKE